MKRRAGIESMTGRSASPTFRAEIRRIIRDHKGRWAFSLTAFQILPFIEVALIAVIYAMLRPGDRGTVEAIAAKIGLSSAEQATSKNVIYWIFGLALVLLLTQAVLRYMAEINLARLRISIYVENAQHLLDRYFNARIALVRKIGKERIASSVLNDCGAVGDYVKLRLDLFGGAWGLLLYLASAIILSWQVLLVAAAIYALPLYLNRRAYRKMRQIGQQKVAAQELMLGFFGDILSGFQRSRLDGLEGALSSEAAGVLNASQKWRLNKNLTQTSVRVTLDNLSLFGVVIVIFVGTVIFKLEIAALMLLFVVFTRMKGFATIISNSLLEIRSQAPHIERYTSLLDDLGGDQPFPSPLAVSPKPLSTAFQKIECRNVGFAYDDETPVLRNVNLVMEPGDRILISGPSGEGKSTLLEIIAGLIEPDIGSVVYDGCVLDEGLFRKVRSSIAFASPTVHLFRGTIRHNLSMGIQDAEAQIEKAVRLAGFDLTLSELPKGLDTRLGDDGNQLSLGQRQRVILARIYLKRAKLILLDEATANLNPSLETELIDRLQSFIDPDCIVVMVAHKAPPNYRYNKHYEMRDAHLSEIAADAAAFAVAGE
jgi:ABC-type multidrug transport system fused ATPase/permease subunit